MIHAKSVILYIQTKAITIFAFHHNSLSTGGQDQQPTLAKFPPFPPLDPQHCWMFTPACTESWLHAVNPFYFSTHNAGLTQYECGRMKPLL